MQHLLALERDLREQVVNEEVATRGSLNCIRVRCQSAGVNRSHSTRTLPPLLAVHPGYSQRRLPLQLGDETAVSLVEEKKGDITAATRPATASSVWEMRRASAAARRKKGNVESDQAGSDDTDPSTSIAATSPVVTARRNTADDEAKIIMNLQRRCITVELHSLQFRYQTVWVTTLDEHQAFLDSALRECRAAAAKIQVVNIQKNYRMHRCRSQYLDVLRRLTLVQSCGRAYAVRRKIPQSLTVLRAQRLMYRCALGYLGRRSVARQNLPRVIAWRRARAAIRIQAIIRCHIAKKHYWFFRRQTKAVRIIQSVVRGFLSRCRHYRKEQDFHTTMKELLLGQGMLDLRLHETALRTGLDVLEHDHRATLIQLSVTQCSAVARYATAKKRLQSPFSDGFSAACGLLGPSMVKRGADYVTPEFSSLFQTPRSLLQAKQRPSSSASRIGASRPHLAMQDCGNAVARTRLRMLLLEAEEARARCELRLESFVFYQFLSLEMLCTQRKRIFNNYSGHPQLETVER